MNIFVLNRDPIKAAQAHNDKHTVKMIVESAQMLCTAHRRIDGTPKQVHFARRFKVLDDDGNLRFRTVRLKEREILILPGDTFRNIHGHTIFKDSVFYRDTHGNHPCSIWCRETVDNYLWLYNLTVALCDEYYHRYGQHKPAPVQHKVRRDGLLDMLATPPRNIPCGTLTPFPQAMPDQYKAADAVQAYRNYYLGEKRDMLNYTNREAPRWI